MRAPGVGGKDYSMPRFFVPSENFTDNEVKISGEDAFHIARALRMAVGDTLTVCDMHGAEYSCTLSRIRDEECVCEILSKTEGRTESPLFISLYMAYPKGDKLETVTQKAVELGASEIVPFLSSRCVKKPKPEKADRENERLTRIAEEAAKQCGRSRLVRILPSHSYSEALKRAKDADAVLFCYEGDGARSLKDILSSLDDKVRSLAVIVGAEGGFSLSEVELAREIGAHIVNLGPRILRCETAPSYILSSISYEFEL
ncbi:MAG: 16S rRNA (uracil(1498)-N(3))-methyltransferase [Clostridia bacterium]|nr:16S rRNA (uracil(1498)-N(3))-methyltransferase [Clostridia bacterium]